MRNIEHPMPSIQAVIELTMRCGQLTNPQIRPVGISVDTHLICESEARSYLQELEQTHGLPATDPLRFGTGPIVERLLEEFPRATR
jgi:uncharacterized NAD-dependent epimerase/dehydratase family protein